MLMSSVTVSNCIKFYQTAEDIGAKDLQKYCTEIISNHWVSRSLQLLVYVAHGKKIKVLFSREIPQVIFNF